MCLELGRIRIREVRFSRRTHIRDGALLIKKDELLEASRADESRIVSLEVNIARPGDATRIMPIKDAIEPRVKVRGRGGIFPGFIAPPETVGSGRTHLLQGAAVITCGQVVGFQEGLLDMSGPGALYSSFSTLINIVLSARVTDNLPQHQHEEALRLMGLRAAAYLGRAGGEVEPDEVEEYPALSASASAGRPRVAYLYMLLSQGLLHDTYVYGQDAKTLLPTFIGPTEVMDGAIVSGNCVSACDKNTTYHHQNNPIIEELYRRHGNDFNFEGVVLASESTTLAGKRRSSDYAVKLLTYLGVDGVVISKEGFGNPDADLMMNCARLEEQGIKTVCLTDEFAGGDGASPSLADASSKADAVVSTGNANERVTLPRMKKTIGQPRSVRTLTGGSSSSLTPDGSLTVQLQAILGATNELGFERLSAFET